MSRSCERISGRTTAKTPRSCRWRRGSRRPSLSLVPNQAGGAGTAVDPGWEPDRAERIPAFRLDQMIDGRVDYVKVDCEGTDDRVVTGAEGLIRANPSLLLTVEHMAIHASRSIPAYRDLGLKPYEIRAFGRLRSTTYEAVAARGEKDVTELFEFALAINEQRHLTSKSAAALRWMRRGASGAGAGRRERGQRPNERPHPRPATAEPRAPGSRPCGGGRCRCRLDLARTGTRAHDALRDRERVLGPKLTGSCETHSVRV